MNKEYEKRIKDLNERLISLNQRIKMFDKLDIDVDRNEISKELIYMAGTILSHAESEIEDVYTMLYRIKVEQRIKDKEE